MWPPSCGLSGWSLGASVEDAFAGGSSTEVCCRCRLRRGAAGRSSGEREGGVSRYSRIYGDTVRGGERYAVLCALAFEGEDDTTAVHTLAHPNNEHNMQTNGKLTSGQGQWGNVITLQTGHMRAHAI